MLRLKTCVMLSAYYTAAIGSLDIYNQSASDRPLENHLIILLNDWRYFIVTSVVGRVGTMDAFDMFKIISRCSNKIILL